MPETKADETLSVEVIPSEVNAMPDDAFETYWKAEGTVLRVRAAAMVKRDGYQKRGRRAVTERLPAWADVEILIDELRTAAGDIGSRPETQDAAARLKLLLAPNGGD